MHKPDYLEEADEKDFNRLLADKKETAGKPSHNRATVELQSAASIDPQPIK